MFYLDLFRALQQEDVRYLVVGGLAVNLYGVERATMDVDLMLAMDAENLARFIRAANTLGLTPVPPVALQSLADEAARASWIEEKRMIVFALRAADPAAPTLDVLIRPPLPFDEVWSRRVEKSIGGLTVRLASGIAPISKRWRKHGASPMTEKIDFAYELSEERLKAYRLVSLYDRLRWLEALCRFTKMMQAASTRDYSQPHAALEPQSSRYAKDK